MATITIGSPKLDNISFQKTLPVESRFLLQYLDIRVGIRQKHHESMNPACLLSVQSGGGGGGGIKVWGEIFLGHFEQFSTTSGIKATAYLSIVADHVQLIS